VFETFLSDARQTEADLWEIRNWFDHMKAQEEGTTPPREFSCALAHGHSIHQPVSTAPADDPNLVGIWHEYSAALAAGQELLDWFVLACNSEVAVFSSHDYTERRFDATIALSQAEHVVTALEAMQ
jgi:hypothetical protein